MAAETDLVVVGTGAAAQSVAFPCREAGWSVTIIDSDPFGGTCQLRGCDPKKVLVGVSELVDWARRMQGRGLAATGLGLEWSEMIRFKHSFVDGVPERMDRAFEEAGMHPVQGRARFVGPTSLRVDHETYVGEHVVVATGARHAPLGIPGEEHLTTSTGFLDLDELPRRVVFVGGGYIAFEFAHIAARAGAEITVLHRGERPLAGFDPDLVAELVRATRELGIDLQVGTSVTAVDARGGELIVRATRGAEPLEVSADLVVHAAGRVPEVDDLDLETAGVARADNGGVAVNDYLQSITNSAVYAAGDAAASGGLPLTPVAGMEGGVVAANLLGGNRRTPDYSAVPTVAFTTPPLARVGLDEATARAQGLRFSTRHDDTSQWYSSRRVAMAHTAFKTLIEDGTGRILGAHLLGPHAEEIVNVFAVAMRAGMDAATLGDMIFAYPTGTSDISYMV